MLRVLENLKIGTTLAISSLVKAQEVSTNIIEVQQGTAETGTASSEALSAAQSLSRDSNHLKDQVGRFRATVRVA
jgi:methyl-accepting chemotaxis protein